MLVRVGAGLGVERRLDRREMRAKAAHLFHPAALALVGIEHHAVDDARLVKLLRAANR